MEHNSNTSDINILIVGETGVGKSTFVNAFANYMNFDSLEHAVGYEDISVVPSKFSIMNDNFETKEFTFGEYPNKWNTPGSSSTIDPRVYKIPYKERSIMMIDTPGVGDASGIERDEKNMQNLLTTIAEFKHLHAILILLKPNESKVSVMFKYCVKQLLSSLEKSASQNIVFLFTNSRGTFYKPGDTVTPLRIVLKEIEDAPPNVSVPFNKTNTFCVDNEAFRFLIAKKFDFNFTEEETREFSKSWRRSAEETHKLLEYIYGLKPHSMKNTVALNTSRTLILRLSKPLAEISHNITDNLKLLDQYKKLRNDNSLSLQELQTRLVVKKIGLDIIKIDKPMTVCGHNDCVMISRYVNGASFARYPQICHKDCQEVGGQKEEFGDESLADCWAFENGMCLHSECGHSFRTHMRIYYKSEPYEYETKDQSVIMNIKTNEEAKADIDKKMANIKDSMKEYLYEQDVIQDAIAKFSHFIKHSTITAVNDTYKDYNLYFIELEKQMGQDADIEKIQYYQRLIVEYEEKVNLLEQELKEKRSVKDTTSAVSSEDIDELYKLLCSLPLYGETIKQALEVQREARYYDQIQITDVKLMDAKLKT